MSFQLITNLLYRVDDGLESLRIVHGEVSKDLAVQTDILLGEFAHKLRIGHAVLTGGSIDSLNPEGTEFALFGFTVTVSIGETFFIGVLGYRPNILPGKEITAGSLENLFAASPGGYGIN